MKYTLFALFVTLSFTCHAQKQKHIVHSPAYHTTHRPPVPEEPTGLPKARKEADNNTSVWACSSYKSRSYHSENSCVELKFCRAGVISMKKTDAVENEGRRPCARCYSSK